MTESTEEAAGRPIPATIPMPDHPIRHTAGWHIYIRLTRATLEWITALGVGHAFLVGPWLRPVSDGHMAQLLGFALILFGVRTYEKTKGVA